MSQQKPKSTGEPRQELIRTAIDNIHRVIRVMASAGFPFGNMELSHPQVGILFCVARNPGGVSVKQLAGALNVTSGAISQSVDRLIEKGLVLREGDLDDRRVFRIKLTKSAGARFEAFKKIYFESVTPLFDELKDQDLKQFITLLEGIKR